MQLIHWIFALLAALLGLMAALLIAGDPAAATGSPHPLVAGMSVGGDGLARLGGLGWLMGLMQVLTLVLIHLLIALGVSERHRTPLFWLLLGSACAISLGIWWGLYASYMDALSSGDTGWLFGFPLATTYMLFGVFAAGGLLCLLYVWGFRRFVLTLEDEAAYEALRAAADTPRTPEPDAGQHSGQN